jgi:hypothetical protein
VALEHRRIEPSKTFVLPYNPTAENMARYLLEVVAPPGGLRLRGAEGVRRPYTP